MSSLASAIYSGLPASVFDAVTALDLSHDHEEAFIDSDAILTDNSANLDRIMAFLFDPEKLSLVVAIAVIAVTLLLASIHRLMSKTKARPTMAIIGCGPTGMFFMHAVALRRQKMEEEGDVKGLAKLPEVTCFEKCSQPGGVWRSAQEAQLNAIARKQTEECASSPSIEEKKDEQQDEKQGDMEESTNMYEGLWTNGHALLLELFDYTFDDHFKRPVLSYMPRAAILDYILARVTRNNPNFFDDNTLFETSVNKVTYDKKIKKFIVTSTDLVTSKVSVSEYDKCLWGAGANGKMKIPKSLQNILMKGNYQGQTMHSSEAGNCLDEFKGKRVLFVGDSSSAEDLALMGCKLGVERMYVYSRQARGSCCDTVCWPSNKVEVLYDQELTGVIQNGKGLRFVESFFNAKKGRYEREKHGEVNDLEDIDAVIFCTGYHPNDDMMDESLFNKEDSNLEFLMPKKWQMKENALTSELGLIKPHKRLNLESWFGMSRKHYCGLDLSNPNLMYSTECEEFPLFEIDIRSWFFLGCILGEIEIPSREEMIYEIRKDLRQAMHVHRLRSELDPNYRMELYNAFEDDHWSYDIEDDRTKAMDDEYYRISTTDLAEFMNDSLYPVSFLTSDGRLNDMGEKFMDIYKISEYRQEHHPDEVDWRTFRDYHDEKYASIYSGTKVVPLKQHWMSG